MCDNRRMRPAPLRTDRSNAFAHYSMSVRVPKILDEVIARNPALPAAAREAVERLRDEIAGDAKLPPLRFPAPDAAEWEAAVAAYHGQTWLATDWFFAECYVYRCLMIAVRYWETGLDPFHRRRNARIWRVRRCGEGSTGRRAACPTSSRCTSPS